MFAYAGATKAFQAIEPLSQTLPWVLEYPESYVRLIGLAELAGSLGLVLPMLLRIKPELVPFAALGLVIVMVLALGFHIFRNEYGALGMNIVLGSIAAFVAWGRSRK